MKDKFIKFLQTEGVYESFMTNLVQYRSRLLGVFYADVDKDAFALEWLLATNEYDFITIAFVWRKTDEGLSFWDRINELWIEELSITREL